jgi:SAM-dependent methyltransferase
LSGRSGLRALLRDLREAWALLVLAVRVRREPEPYARRVASGVVDHLAEFGVALPGAISLDAGCGAGALVDAVADRGARSFGLDVADFRAPAMGRGPFVIGTGELLPFRDGAFDIVLSSNVLEHVPSAERTIDELVRVCRGGGTIYLSWTNWYSPLGGHEFSPFHYLGEDLGVRVYRRIWRRPPRWNIPGKTLFKVHIEPVLAHLRSRRDVAVVEMAPRYWRSLRFIARLRGVREVAMWNCVFILRRLETKSPGPPSAGPIERDAPSQR